MAALGRLLLLVLLLSLLSVAYLSPGFSPVIGGDVSRVMSDGTDATTLPYLYGVVLETWKEAPRDLLFGAIPGAHLNAPEGIAIWMPWIERWGALALTPFLPLEHISTVLVALLMVFNALCMYALSRRLGWSRSLSLALAIAWAFSPFTRGRAQVHATFASTYHVPLALLGLMMVIQDRSWRSLAAAAGCFLLVAMAPHYFVITLAFLSPLVLALGFLAVRDQGKCRLKTWGRLALATLPMIALLAWCFFKPLPARYLEAGAQAHLPSGETLSGDSHPFLSRFAAHPIDYFTGDIALGDKDWNPLREQLSKQVLANLGDSNAHERANGIRWVVWLLVIGGLLVWPRANRQLQAGLVVFALFSLWLSMSPDLLWPSGGPAYWLYSLVSQIRVPSRAGIFVHFAALLIAGIFFHHWIENYAKPSRWRKIAAFPGVLPLLMIFDLPPGFQPMQISQVLPQLHTLVNKECGTGLYFPYVAGNIGVMEDYYFLQEMRGSSCEILNAQWPNQRSAKLYQVMGLSHAMLEAFNQQKPEGTRAIEQLVRCAPLNWIVFDPRTDYFARAALCRTLGWVMTEERVCQTPGRATRLRKKPEECL